MSYVGAYVALYLGAYLGSAGSGSLVPLSIVPNTPTVRTKLGGLLDQLLDPVTRDYIDTDDGEWLETADSRTLMWIMLETRLGKSPISPGDGTRVQDLFDNTGEPITVKTIAADYLRAAGILEAAGIIADFSIVTTDARGNPLVDVATGRFTPILRWTDLASGSPVDFVFAPLGGG